MITQAIFNVIFSLIGILLAWLPSINTFPEILSVDVDELLVNGVAYFTRLSEIFPPFNSILIAATTYISFKIIMVLLKVVLGSRVPHHAKT